MADVYAYAHMNTLSTSTLRTGGGILHTVVVNAAGAAGNTLTIYDSTAGSGTVIAVLNASIQGTYMFDCGFGTGLTAVLATGTAADVTITYA